MLSRPIPWQRAHPHLLPLLLYVTVDMTSRACSPRAGPWLVTTLVLLYLFSALVRDGPGPLQQPGGDGRLDVLYTSQRDASMAAKGPYGPPARGGETGLLSSHQGHDDGTPDDADASFKQGSAIVSPEGRASPASGGEWVEKCRSEPGGKWWDVTIKPGAKNAVLDG
jgi:hypothetical protein